MHADDQKNAVQNDGKNETPASIDFHLWALAWEMGYTIAIPLVAFALLGRFADKYFDSSPLFLLIGMLLAIAASTVILMRKMKKFF